MSTAVAAVDQLVARGYQDELAQYARDYNAILAADTGTGKTLISALVIRWRMAIEAANRTELTVDTKKALPQVPLVEQQRLFLEDNTTLVIRGYTGAMGVDGWNRAAWIKEFMEADVLVMTGIANRVISAYKLTLLVAQIFLNVLNHAHWKMEQVAIIVFDEVHNCKGSSPQAQIMRNHYHTIPPEQTRPKILGLTASPIFNPKNPVKALQEIEKLTDCRVCVVRQYADELAKHTFRARAQIMDFPRTPSQFPSYIFPSLWDELHHSDMLPNCKRLMDDKTSSESVSGDWYGTLKSRYLSTEKALGPFGADIFLFVHISTALESIKDGLAPVYAGSDDPDAEKRKKVEEILEILKKHKARFSTEGETLPHGWLSPKVLALRTLLQKQDASKFRGMIFVAERQIATTLSLLIPRLGLPDIKAGPLVGHGLKICSEPTQIGMKGMSFRAQDNIVKDFRQGRLNLLIATSVAEEGLDFPLCSFVCRFDPPKTLPQYIQSRGRARQAESSFIIMLEEGPSPERGKVEMLQIGEGLAKEIYDRKMDRLEDNSLDDDATVDVDDFPEDRLLVEKTGASLTPADSISLLNNLCSLIPHDQYTRPLIPKYKIDPITFRCEVRLPSALPIPRDQLVYHSTPFSRSKRAAKRSAAFHAVKALYGLEVFDDYLLPIRRGKSDTIEDVDGKLPIDVSAIEPMMEVLVHDPWGNAWEEDAPLYFHTIDIPGRSGMAMVCAQWMRSYEGKMMAKRVMTDFRLSDGILIELDPEEKLQRLQLMDKFTKQVLRLVITRKGLTRPSSLFFVPVDPAGLPDWHAMEHAVCTPASTDWRAIEFSGSPDIL
ncbi:Dicer-like protein 1, partial [Serendipita sp. 399]